MEYVSMFETPGLGLVRSFFFFFQKNKVVCYKNPIKIPIPIKFVRQQLTKNDNLLIILWSIRLLRQPFNMKEMEKDVL